MTKPLSVSFYALALFVGLQVLDVLTTAAGIAAGAQELNPIAAGVLASLGTLPGLLAIKGAGVAIVVGCLAWGRWRFPRHRLHWHLLTVVNLGYYVVVVNNLATIGAALGGRA